ncbi:MAG: phenylacetate-CoA oxygenase/reductase subunit PaaK [Chitinophagaceae bacterium]|nr:phenylacetate-CoA oxygenase/reductase subunit PaaK [Chitinophagaceae bacterium]
MSQKFHLVRIKDIRRETADCVSIAFDIPEEKKSLFQFTQGQYISIKKDIDGVDIRRSYSICSSPFDDELRIAVKKVEGGIFSTYASKKLSVGDSIEIMPPLGKFFTPLDADQTLNYAAFAAGSGITPILSIIKTTLLTEPNSTFTLVYGNKNRHSIIFREAIEALKNKFIHRFRVLYILSREKTDTPIQAGRIDTEKCSVLFEKVIDNKHIDHFFICGPHEMTETVKNTLSAHGVQQHQIHVELFGAAKEKSSTFSLQSEVKETESTKSNITIKLDGVSFDFELSNRESILDAALAQGADLPFACKGGVCCTCKAKLLAGEVIMDVHYGLEPDEIAAGFILTCQSHPKTQKVVVDFDTK